MAAVRSCVISGVLLLLSACTALPFRFPWPTGRDQGSASSSISGAESAMKSGKALPPLMVLAEAGLAPAPEQELLSCAKDLGLADEVDALADATNYGDRKTLDAWQRNLQAKPLIIVLHETVIGEQATLAMFQTPHPNDADQASYHMLIARDGTRLRIVPDEKRAYGAGMSAFGDVTQRTKPPSVGSVNNIALHLSLVSPPDGRDDRSGHSGYTLAQYRNLAAQVLLWQAKFGIPLTRLTTHEAVDRSRSRYDPRSFRWDRFDSEYRQAARLCGFQRFDNGQAGPA